MWSTPYSIYTVVLSFNPFLIIAVIICQLLADRHRKQKKNIDYRTKGLLFGVYISAGSCSILGYILHHSKTIPLFCRVYGFTPCFAAYAASKSCLLGFFLRRARKSNITDKSKWKKLFFNRIGPLYIAAYFIIYLSISSIIFRGSPTTKDEKDVISYCLFDKWQWWFVILANIVDLFNCIASLLLFLLPLIKSIKRLKISTDNVNNVLLRKFVKAMKWNVALSFTAALSSLLALCSIPIAQEYIWLFCTGDPLINAFCCFSMISTNRKFVKHKLCKCCAGSVSESQFGHSKTLTQTQNIELPTSTLAGTSTDKRNSAYNMEEFITTSPNEEMPAFTPSEFNKSNPILNNNPYFQKKIKLTKINSY